MKYAYLMVVFVVFLFAGGCSTQTAGKIRGFVQDHNFALGVVVRSVATDYVTSGGTVSQSITTARRVLDTVARIRDHMGNRKMTADQIYVVVTNEIKEEELSPGQAIAINEILIAARNQINKRIAEGEIPADTIATVNQFLGWVEQAATPYAY